MKLLLSSMTTTGEQDAALASLVGKAPTDMKVAYIANAYDVYDDDATVLEGRDEIASKGFDVEHVDLREWMHDRVGLQAKLARKDVFLFTGGNPFYLRWMLKATGADHIIIELLQQGKVYSGASAAAVVAGPTLRYFDNQDDPNAAEEVIWDGLNLTDIVIVPHTDNAEFGAGCIEAGDRLAAEGYTTQPLTDAQAFLIDGDKRRLI